MSSSPTPAYATLLTYVRERTRGKDPFLGELQAAALAQGMPAIWISPEQGSLMQILLRLCRAREVVEVGTLAGYSAILMARALPPGGRVRTIEIEAKHAAFARTWIARSDVADRIEVIDGAGADVLRTLPNASADACFIDADKPGYRDYLEECLRILRPNGLVLADNAFAFGQLLDQDDATPSVVAMREFNDHVAGRSDLHGIIVPVGDGCWVGIKTG